MSGLGEQGAKAVEGFGEDLVVRPAAALLAGNEPSFEEDFEVMADGGLGEAQRGGEVTDAGFVVGLGLEEAQEA